jgi:hypothetical protein
MGRNVSVVVGSLLRKRLIETDCLHELEMCSLPFHITELRTYTLAANSIYNKTKKLQSHTTTD